ncbi:MAG TPA: hypothetical protein PKI62_13965, partial [bacterium]|nr:hypothetical protein [bacterium]
MKRFTFILMAALTVFLFSGAMTNAAARSGQHRHIRIAPPAPRVVIRPACPFHLGVWIEGYWNWHDGHYVWIEGRWIKPRAGQDWVDGRWMHTRYGWDWMPGYWQRARMDSRFHDRDGYSRSGRGHDRNRDRDQNRDRGQDQGRDRDQNRDRGR